MVSPWPLLPNHPLQTTSPNDTDAPPPRPPFNKGSKRSASGSSMAGPVPRGLKARLVCTTPSSATCPSSSSSGTCWFVREGIYMKKRNTKALSHLDSSSDTPTHPPPPTSPPPRPHPGRPPPRPAAAENGAAHPHPPPDPDPAPGFGCGCGCGPSDRCPHHRRCHRHGRASRPGARAGPRPFGPRGPGRCVWVVGCGVGGD